MNYKIIFFVFIIINLPAVVYADMVWPSLYIEEGIQSWWIIVSGLLIETLFIRFFTDDKWLKSLKISVIINCTSAILGIVLIPLTGFLGELLLLPVDGIFKMYTFHDFHWLVAYVGATLTNTLIEGLILSRFFKISLKKSFFWLFVANGITVFETFLALHFFS